MKTLLTSAAIRLAERLSGLAWIALDSRPTSAGTARYGHGRAPHQRLTRILENEEEAYRRNLGTILEYQDDFLAIARTRTGIEPYWLNEWFSGLDAMSLYAFLRDRNPRRYVEIGSGISTMFAARAIRDGNLRTSIESIDPSPRLEIGSLCEVVVREPLQEVDIVVFSDLASGDVVLFDGSHRIFMNSDVTVFFLDVLPELAPGVLVGVHDIYLPDDYPPEVATWYLSEQYLLAAYLLAGYLRIVPVLPCRFVSSHPGLRDVVGRTFADPHFRGVTRVPTCFWFETRTGESA